MASHGAEVALVTGSSAGIGRATALALSGQGYVTHASARRPDELKQLLRPSLKTLRLDVNDEHSMFSAVQAIETQHGAVDVLREQCGH